MGNAEYMGTVSGRPAQQSVGSRFPCGQSVSGRPALQSVGGDRHTRNDVDKVQRQHMLEGGLSSYSREVRSASCGPPSDRTWLYSPSGTRCSYMGGIKTKSGMDLSNMYRYQSSEPVRYSVHQRFRSRFL